MRYRDREHAGEVLADALREHDAVVASNPLILGLPRGGVPVAAAVQRDCGGQLDVLIVQKVGAPGHPELGIGAVAEDGSVSLDVERARRLGLAPAALESAVAAAGEELRRRVAVYRSPGASPLPVAGRNVIVVDDGLATGVTAMLALELIRRRSPVSLILAVPVAPRHVDLGLASPDVAFVCPVRPQRFRSVGEWYDDFGQVSDQSVLACLDVRAPRPG